jgi:hypothetical protein
VAGTVRLTFGLFAKSPSSPGSFTIICTPVSISTGMLSTVTVWPPDQASVIEPIGVDHWLLFLGGWLPSGGPT